MFLCDSGGVCLRSCLNVDEFRCLLIFGGVLWIWSGNWRSLGAGCGFCVLVCFLRVDCSGFWIIVCLNAGDGGRGFVDLLRFRLRVMFWREMTLIVSLNFICNFLKKFWFDLKCDLFV